MHDPQRVVGPAPRVHEDTRPEDHGDEFATIGLNGIRNRTWIDQHQRVIKQLILIDLKQTRTATGRSARLHGKEGGFNFVSSKPRNANNEANKFESRFLSPGSD